MINSFLPKNIELNPSNLNTLSHSKMVANAAKLISEKTKILNPEKAYTYGLLHDVGKFYLPKNESYKHPRKGYELLKNNYPNIANICISHAFPDFNSYQHILNYCKKDKIEAEHISNILKSIKKNDYIDLIQLCDKLSALDNYISIESKLDWYQNNYRINTDELNLFYSPLKNLKHKFDILSNCNIYDILKVS